VITKNPW